MKELWKDLLLEPGNEDLAWELFHENSKRGRYDNCLSDEEILERMEELHESLPFVGYPIVELPISLIPLKHSLNEVLTSRASANDMAACPLSLEQTATLLHYAYGVTRGNEGTHIPRPFRVVPSGGALYPLEIFFHSTHIQNLAAGLYHYNAAKNQLRLLYEGDHTSKISNAMIQSDIGHAASLVIFITAIFERSIFKYGDRGYRFVLLEAGHVAQNINLVANALGLGCRNVGGYFDREIDDFLGLDGITHSTIYMVVIGKKSEVTKKEAMLPPSGPTF